MTHPYGTIEYGGSLRHVGDPIYVAEWGTTVLRRTCGPDQMDATGTYPITVIQPGCDLPGGLDRLMRLGLVSVVLVFADLLRPDLTDLGRAFDFVRQFKVHYVFDRNGSPLHYSRNHRYKIRRAAHAVKVNRFELTAHLDQWIGLYQGLAARLGLEGTMHAFPSAHHETLARLAGTVAVGAFVDGRLVSCHVWICHDGHAMSHLVASNDEGYALRAAYAVNAASIDLLGECRTLNFGGAAGTGEEDSDGLVRFKRGFANRITPSYLCGKVLAADTYAELTREAGVSIDSAYFPAYRQRSSGDPAATAELPRGDNVLPTVEIGRQASSGEC